MANRVRYRVTHHLPHNLRFRNGIVVLEVVRDVVVIPSPFGFNERFSRRAQFAWVLRARRPGVLAAQQGREHLAHWVDLSPEERIETTAVLANPLPTISPAALIAATQQANEQQVVILSSLYGWQDLERRMRRGFVVDADSPEGRLMEILVRLGYAVGEPA